MERKWLRTAKIPSITRRTFKENEGATELGRQVTPRQDLEELTNVN